MTTPISFTNEFGQVIQPGDEVMFVTKSTGLIAIRRGTYVGMAPSGGAQVKADRQVSLWEHENGMVDRTYRYKGVNKHAGYIMVPVIKTLYNNNIYKLV